MHLVLGVGLSWFGIYFRVKIGLNIRVRANVVVRLGNRVNIRVRVMNECSHYILDLGLGLQLILWIMLEIKLGFNIRVKLGLGSTIAFVQCLYLYV